MKFKSSGFAIAYYQNGRETFLYKSGVEWFTRGCKEEACAGSQKSSCPIILYYSPLDSAALCAKFNEYANLIGLSAQASVEELIYGLSYEEKCDIIALANTLNPLEREAAAILIRTINRSPELLKKKANMKSLLATGIYFQSSSSLCETFLNWKKFISGVTEEQLGRCTYNFNHWRHGGLINWLDEKIV